MKSRDENRVIFFDTTSRDGKQSPGCQHSPDDTVALAHQLAKMGVDIMEAGFAIASDADFEAVRRVATEVPIRTCSLARAKPNDIEWAAKALENAKKPPRIHTFIASSNIHMRGKLLMTPQQVIEAVIKAVELARKYVDDVEFSPEDSARTGFDFLKEIVAVAIKAGATTINIPDTVGYAVGDEYGIMIARLITEVPLIIERGIIISTHCHNDLANAVANTLAGLKAGARQAECTILGIGERAGNTQFEPVVMALRTRQDYYGLDVSRIDTIQIGPTARLVSAIIKKPISDTQPIVGGNVFGHGAGIHQDGVLKERTTYEIMTQESVGWQGESLPLISQSGRHGLKKRLAALGYIVEGDQLNRVYQKFTALADTKTYVYNPDLYMIMQEVLAEEKAESEHWIKLVRVDYHKVGDQRSVTVHLSCNSDIFEASGTGNGPVSSTWDAIQNALTRKGLWPGEVKLRNFDVGKGPGGVEAMGLAIIEIEHNNRIAYGRGADTDIIVAYAKAEVAAINHLHHVPIEKSKVAVL